MLGLLKGLQHAFLGRPRRLSNCEELPVASEAPRLKRFRDRPVWISDLNFSRPPEPTASCASELALDSTSSLGLPSWRAP